MLKPFDEALRELVSQYESAHYDPFEMRTVMAEVGRELTHDRAPNNVDAFHRARAPRT